MAVCLSLAQYIYTVTLLFGLRADLQSPSTSDDIFKRVEAL